MSPERILSLRGVQDCEPHLRECLDEIGHLQKEVSMLKESRAAATESEQRNRLGWNNARAEIKRLINALDQSRFINPGPHLTDALAKEGGKATVSTLQP